MQLSLAASRASNILNGDHDNVNTLGTEVLVNLVLVVASRAPRRPCTCL